MAAIEQSPAPARMLGGQAVIEGVMIRGPRGMAVCVRKPDGELACHSEQTQQPRLRGVPVVRGVLALGDTLTQGMRAMVWSAQVAAGKEPEAPSEQQVRATTAISLGFATGLFLLAPAVATRRLERALGGRSRIAALMEGVVRLGILVSYLRTVGRLPQAQRLFAYHGAEHRAIQAYEADEPLEVASLRRFPNAHVRCGTSFLLTATVVSSIISALLGGRTLGRRLFSRLAVTPLVAGLSYEAIRLGSTAPSSVAGLLFKPNMALQSLTTRDPDEAQMEVALAALREAIAVNELG